MVTFTVNFKDNDIYFNSQKAYLSNQVLVEILNTEMPDLKELKIKLQKKLSDLNLFCGMENYLIEQYDSHVQVTQKIMTSIDKIFRDLAISKYIASDEALHSQKLFDVLNTCITIWDDGLDSGDFEEDELYYSGELSNEYGFSFYNDNSYSFCYTKFEPGFLKYKNSDYNVAADLEMLNTAVKNLFNSYVTFLDDILRVKEVYTDFINNYLNADHKFLDNSALAEKFTYFLEKHNNTNTSYLSFTSGYAKFSHSVIKDTKGKSLLCKTYTFKSLGAFLYYDLFNGIENNYIPKKCENCGKYFLIPSGKYTDYCENVSPHDSTKTCREVGARKRYDDKCKTDPVWREYNKAYKTHYARYMKKKMTVSEFEEWASWAIVWRTKAENDEIKFNDYVSEIKK